ncbi:MAG: 16S rRNA (cytosine(1402)-N(4))-methyltransferase RsmH [Nitrospinae bacterium]|nr:16S rRNA (cytosine(1402)-N(4))-methyltransferase RsmH [Nitrospinota bacterium]
MAPGAGHKPVLLDEVVGWFDRPETKVMVDGTLGGGGHAEALLARLPGIGRYIGIDRDADAIERCKVRLAPFGDRVTLAHASFFDMADEVKRLGVGPVDGILLDLGVSSYQLDQGERGFSFMTDGPLDMRMDRRQERTAATLVNEADEAELVRMFFEYGEEPKARRVAKAIVEARRNEVIESTGRLARIVEEAAPRKRDERLHPATKVFMALRIAVNDELSGLGAALQGAIGLLAPGGRIGVIAFHSLEDRIVKRTLADEERRCVCPKRHPVCTCGEPGRVKVLTRKPVMPGEAEEADNPRARSARLRVAERLR